MVAGQPLDQLIEHRPGGTVASVPADAKARAREAIRKAVDIGFADVDLFGFAVALGPVASG